VRVAYFFIFLEKLLVQVGDLVKIIAPESVVGWPAGKVGLITVALDKYHALDYIISVVCSDGAKNVYVLCHEVKIFNANR